MEKIHYQDIDFVKNDNQIRCIFYDHFYFDIPYYETYKVIDGDITIENKAKRHARRLHMHIENGIVNDLKSIKDNKPTIFVDKHSEIPLIGNVGFGIVDRNTNVIEIKPITGCNLKCIYCSVNEGRRKIDFLVEADYLIEELNNLIMFKDDQNIDIHIGGQGEPLRYKYLEYFISEISKNKAVKNISIDTNALLLDQKKADNLIKAGLTQINLSINAIDSEIAIKIAGAKSYNVEKTIDTIKYLHNQPIKLVLAPVFMKTINDEEIENIVALCAKYNLMCGIQNFLKYPGGRNPVNQIEWKEFRGILQQLEEKYNVKLLLSEEDFNIHKTKELVKPFTVNDVIKARIVCEGQFKNEFIASYKNRSITISNKPSIGKEYEIKISKDKHNIFYAK